MEKKYPVLAGFGNLAERYWHTDPNSCIMKIGMMGETIVNLIYEIDRIPRPREDRADERIKKLLYEEYITADLSDVLHELRKKRNHATHENYGTERDAKRLLPMAYGLAEWFYMTYGDWSYQHRDYVFPSNTEERAINSTEEAVSDEAWAAEALEQAKTAEHIQASERKKRAYEAASLRQKSEAETRETIDEQLRRVGWEADTENLRYEKGARPQKGRNLAIAEWPTIKRGKKSSGRVDYALFRGLTLLGMVEAKAEHKDVLAVMDYQGVEYPSSVRPEDLKYTAGAWGENGKYRVPFMFATNGKPYIKQFETKSGIWFRDLRDASNAPKALHGWMSPDGLYDMLGEDTEKANRALECTPYSELTNPDGLGLRYYQLEAVQATEKAIAEGKKEILLAMATGTGKTRTVLGIIYRFLKSGRFRRILFLVDRNELGDQAGKAFHEVPLEDVLSLDKLYNIMGLNDGGKIQRETSVQIATVQSMVHRVLFHEGDMPAVNDFDLIIVDEAHRGYLLDREMTADQATYSDQKDYMSKYRHVVEYFDAVKIALTATPALHTTKIFGNPIYSYTYRQAVVDGFLVDHDPPIQIDTKLRKQGIHYKKGEIPVIYDPVTGEVTNGAELEDELDFDVEKFNKTIIVEGFTRACLEEIAKHFNPMKESQGKMLIFAVKDSHADMIVQTLKEIYGNKGVPTEAVMKITGSVANGNQKAIHNAIQRFKNEKYPSIVVTVDLLSTGVDVLSITNIVFLRFVKSRILYEQMIGRATRKCDAIKKSKFVIYDCVGTCEALQDVSNMKPVAAQVKLTFEKLVDELKAVPDAEEPLLKARLDVLQVKLRTKQKSLTKETQEYFKILTKGTSIETLLETLQGRSPKEARQAVLHCEEGLRHLDEVKHSVYPVIISSKPDMVMETRLTLGSGSTPEDYIAEFTEWVKANRNEVAALNIICTSPKSLTRKQLKELRLIMDNKKFDERSLNKALSAMTKTDIAADIISLVRRSAIGAPLISHEERMEKAVSKVIAKLKAEGSLTQIQEDFLMDVRDCFLSDPDYVVNMEMVDQDEARFPGGCKRFNKIFGGKLQEVMDSLNEALYEEGA